MIIMFEIERGALNLKNFYEFYKNLLIIIQTHINTPFIIKNQQTILIELSNLLMNDVNLEGSYVENPLNVEWTDHWDEFEADTCHGATETDKIRKRRQPTLKRKARTSTYPKKQVYEVKVKPNEPKIDEPVFLPDIDDLESMDQEEHVVSTKKINMGLIFLCFLLTNTNFLGGITIFLLLSRLIVLPFIFVISDTASYKILVIVDLA
uniref:Uncharacterized protein n=1 Tax=Choristoneura fumiferana granulovirus TaxID=56947 RepID=Q8B588_GVCF|nr:unknown [Choristoneura fumiferana granulovirus]